jgi:Fe-S-cluster containining protein
MLRQLERQIQRGNLFAHTALGQSLARLGETTVFLHALLDVLLAKGAVTADELALAVENVRQELVERGELTGPGTAVRVESPEQAAQSPTPVDCEARMHVCRAVCCKLDFALTIPEIESGAAKWDLGRPYFIRHEESGYCTHNDRETGGCSIYARRPGVCCRYSCADDERIWQDFREMELNVAWLQANLAPEHRLRLVGTFMEDPTPRTLTAGESLGGR